jgi:hypothetical protein
MIAHLTTTHATEPNKLRRELLAGLGRGRRPISDLGARAKAQIAARAAAAKQP